MSGDPGGGNAAAAPAAGSSRGEVARVRVDDPRMRPLLRPGAELAELATGLLWAEGPAWVPGLGLVFSDVHADRELLWREGVGLSVRRRPSGHSNGHAVDRAGRVVACESGRRAVTRTDPDGGGEVVLAARYGGGRLNSPNDVTLGPDGAPWFSDPTYGLEKPEEGGPAEAEQPHRGVYRIDPATGAVALMTDEMSQPNGLVFSPDGRALHVSDTGDGREGVWTFDVPGDGRRLGPGRLLCRAGEGKVDGLRSDREGNLWCATGAGVEVFAPDGAPLGLVAVPETAANLCFGGADGGRLFICASTRLLAIDVAARG